MSAARQHFPAVSVILANHLERIGRLMTQSSDGYLDLGRELQFFVRIGKRRWLQDDDEFKTAWGKFEAGPPADSNVVVQDWKFQTALEVLEIACGIYLEAGVLMPTATPWDTPIDEPEEEVPAV